MLKTSALNLGVIPMCQEIPQMKEIRGCGDLSCSYRSRASVFPNSAESVTFIITDRMTAWYGLSPVARIESVPGVLRMPVVASR